jgi:CrcB protein
MSFTLYLWIGLGGALGSVLRGALNHYIPFHVQGFSWSTFIVNMLGCLLIGLLWVKLENEIQKAFWITGVLGGLTTFSGLGLELMRYLNEKNIQLAVLYGCSSLIIGILLVWFGQKLASLY